MLVAGATLACAAASPVAAGTPGDVARAAAALAADNAQGALDAIRCIDAGTVGEVPLPAQWLEAEALFRSGRYADAARAYASAADNDPGSAYAATAMLKTGQCLMAQGDYDGALAEMAPLTDAMVSYTDAPVLAFTRGVCLLAMNRNAEADAQFAAAAADSRLGAEANYYRAYIAFAGGDYAGARRMVANNSAAGADFLKTELDFVEGSYSKALAGARRLLRGTLSADRATELERIAGESLCALGRADEAAPYLRRYMSAAPKPAPSAAFALGRIEYSAGNYSEAVRLFETASQAPGAIGQGAALYLGQALYHQGRPDAAILAFDRAMKATDGTDEQRRAAYFNYAAARFAGGEVPFGSSAAEFENFLAEYPDGDYADRVRSYLAEGYIADGQYSRALARLDGMAHRDSRANGTLAKVLALLADSALTAGDAEGAASYLDRASRSGNAGADVARELVLTRGRLDYQRGDYVSAARSLRQYLRDGDNAPNTPFAAYLLGYTLFNDRRYSGADAAFNRAMTSGAFTGAQLADILDRRGDIAFYGGDYAGARSYYRRAYEAAPATGDYAVFNEARMLGYERSYEAKLARLDDFKRTFGASPLMPDALLETTQALISLGRNDEAVGVYRTLIADYPLTRQGRNGYLQLAMTLLDMNRRDDAMEEYHQVISRYPTSEEAARATELLRRMYADDNRGDEFVAFMAGVEGAPALDSTQAAELTYNAARHDLTANADTTAMSRFMATYPDSPYAEDALEALAEANYNAGRIPQSLARWRQLLARASTPGRSVRARLGEMRSCRDIGDLAGAGTAAEAVLAAADAPADAVAEASFTLGNALADSGDNARALQVWSAVADRTDNLYGMRSGYAAAEAVFDSGDNGEALRRAQALTASRSPHQYWVARAFILQARIYKAMGRDYEAREYLRALRDNYPGNEPDIRDMIEQLLDE